MSQCGLQLTNCEKGLVGGLRRRKSRQTWSQHWWHICPRNLHFKPSCIRFAPWHLVHFAVLPIPAAGPAIVTEEEKNQILCSQVFSDVNTATSSEDIFSDVSNRWIMDESEPFSQDSWELILCQTFKLHFMLPDFSHAVHFLPAEAMFTPLILRDSIHRKVTLKCFDSFSNTAVFLKKLISAIHLMGACNKIKAPAPGRSSAAAECNALCSVYMTIWTKWGSCPRKFRAVFSVKSV